MCGPLFLREIKSGLARYRETHIEKSTMCVCVGAIPATFKTAQCYFCPFLPVSLGFPPFHDIISSCGGCVTGWDFLYIYFQTSHFWRFTLLWDVLLTVTSDSLNQLEKRCFSLFFYCTYFSLGCIRLLCHDCKLWWHLSEVQQQHQWQRELYYIVPYIQYIPCVCLCMCNIYMYVYVLCMPNLNRTLGWTLSFA